jgi:hypothetical protein
MILGATPSGPLGLELFSISNWSFTITEHQSGFQSKDSTVNQLVYIYNTIISNLDIGRDIRFIFGDISKAFDRVWHTVESFD